MDQPVSRARFTAAAAATFASIAFVRAPARAAQFEYRYGNDQTASSPVTARAMEMWRAVEHETGGRLVVKTFPDSTLGGDTQMMQQVRSGALHFLTEAGLILGNVVPLAQIDGLAFAYKDEATAYRAMDGELGEYVRKEISTKGMYCFPRPWTNGFREITANKPIRSAADLEGLKIRVPASPLMVDMFKSLGASPTPINVSELYTALQTHVVEAQENSLINTNQSKLYEVQKTINFSNHCWSCWWFLANTDAWNALPHDIQDVVTRNVIKYGALQRRDSAQLTASLADKLHRQGMQLVQCDIGSFKAKLGGYYANWKDKFGPTAWSLLEKTAGKVG